MKIIKLNAIDSTNEYLKNLSKDISIENYTIVTANYQTNGKGQMQNYWHSKKGKNLLVSILVRFEDFKIKDQVYLSFAISNAIYKVLSTYLTTIKIKWPNDIMAGQNKICGILIENTVKNDRLNKSIVGIGLNVNQINFPSKLTNITSLQKELQKEINCEELLVKLINSIKSEITILKENMFAEIYNYYRLNLYRLDLLSKFKTTSDKIYLGKIIGVTDQGELQVELENKTIKKFEIKEVSLI